MCVLLRCSFRLRWAMQEPWFVGRATGTATHTFLYLVPNNQNRNLILSGVVKDDLKKATRDEKEYAPIYLGIYDTSVFINIV